MPFEHIPMKGAAVPFQIKITLCHEKRQTIIAKRLFFCDLLKLLKENARPLMPRSPSVPANRVQGHFLQAGGLSVEARFFLTFPIRSAVLFHLNHFRRKKPCLIFGCPCSFPAQGDSCPDCQCRISVRAFYMREQWFEHKAMQ